MLFSLCKKIRNTSLGSFLKTKFLLFPYRRLGTLPVFLPALFLSFILLSGTAQSKNFPLKISEIHTPNSIVSYKGQKLILLDFWATWCGPCRIAGKQLEILQEQLKDELFIISVTDETHESVERFIKKHPAKLMTVRDVGGELFRKFKIYTRPHAVLFTADGNILWQGHPAELKYNKIKKLHQNNRHIQGKNSVDEILKLDKIEKISETEEEAYVEEVRIEKIKDTDYIFIKKQHSVDYSGSVRDLVALINHVPRHFVQGNGNTLYVHLQSPRDTWENAPDEILQLLQTNFKIRIVSKISLEKVRNLNFAEDGKLWDTNQIDWGKDAFLHHLIGEDRVQADDFSIADFCVLLSNIKNKTFHYAGSDNELYDWDVHFRFDDLMETEFLNEYGIKFEEKYTEVIHYFIE